MMEIYIFGAYTMCLYIVSQIIYHILSLRFKWSYESVLNQRNVEIKFEGLVNALNGRISLAYLIAGLDIIVVFLLMVFLWPIIVIRLIMRKMK